MLENFSIAAEVGFLAGDGPQSRQSSSATARACASISWTHIEGEPVLNAIRIYRNH
ncbi:MAG: hypothetical protein ACLSHL_09940 [Alistipes communis]